MPRPLDGVVVLDLSRLLPGPFCTQLLANLGADVIKIEDPAAGDYLRGVPPLAEDMSYLFVMVNRGKRSVVLDLKEEAGREALYRLVKKADVFVEQFRPRTVRALGIDYPRLRRVNPNLVYCSFGGFGRTGPYANLPGHDLNFVALSGILSVTAGEGGRPAIPGVPVSDLAGAFMAAFSIVASLHRRARFGGGEFLDVSIFDAGVALNVLNLAHYVGTGLLPKPGETLVTGIFPFYNLYETKDGRWLAVACAEPKFWRRMCEFIGLEEHVEDQFAGGDTGTEVTAKMVAAFRRRTLSEWMAVFEGEELPISPVQRMDEVVKDPHVRGRGLLREVRIGGKPTLVVTHPAKASATDVRTPTRIPARGQDTAAVLRWAGYTAREVRELQRTGAAGVRES